MIYRFTVLKGVVIFILLKSSYIVKQSCYLGCEKKWISQGDALQSESMLQQLVWCVHALIKPPHEVAEGRLEGMGVAIKPSGKLVYCLGSPLWFEKIVFERETEQIF